MLLLTLAFLASVAYAFKRNAFVNQQGPYCENLRIKSSLQAFINCPINFGGYHVICESVPFYLAEAACNNFGWKLADTRLQDVADIFTTVQACTAALYLWVDGFNGYPEDPCMLLHREGFVIPGLSQCESLNQAAVLCQDIPTFTETDTEYSTTTTTYGTSTVTVATYDPAHCHKQPGPPPPCQHCKKEDMLKSNQQLLPCPRVCPLEIGNLRLVVDFTLARDAVQKCAFYGWTLADLTTGTFGAAYEMILECAPNINPIWINSYNGINSTCSALLTDPDVIAENFVGLVMDPTLCSSSGYVLCQDACAPPAVTGSGLWTGTASYVTNFASATVTVTVPSTTRTVTSYAVSDRIHLKLQQ